MSNRRLLVMVMLLWALGVTLPSSAAQTKDLSAVSQGGPVTQKLSPKATPGTQNLTGWISLLYGDPAPKSGQRGVTRIVLNNDTGSTIAQLSMNESDARTYLGQRVTVQGVALPPVATFQASGGQSVPLMSVEAVTPVIQSPGTAPAQLSSVSGVSGSQPWINVTCRFSDYATEPHNVAFYGGLFSTSYPGLDNYWQQISSGLVNLSGTTTTSTWFVLPYNRAHYLPGGSADLNALAQDCTAAADASVYFPNFVGINLMFNADLDCCAWGGNQTMTLDGQTKSYRMTWLPPWAQAQAYLAHEMGHGFGLPHSSGPADNPPSGLNIYVSDWDVMSASSGTCAAYDANYGCLATGTNGYYLEMAGWLPPSREVTVTSGTQNVTLERLRLNTSTTSTLLAKVPIAGSSRRFYTVQVHDLSGYDQNVPGQAVIIYYVNLDYDVNTNTGPALVVDADVGVNTNVNDAGAMWEPGETYTDAANNISIGVLSKSGSTYTVRITNGGSSNDSFSTPTVIPSLPYSNSQPTGTASKATDDPTPTCATNFGHTVWYRYTATTNGVVRFSTAGSSYDTVLAVYTGGAPGSLTQIACNDDTGDLTSQVDVPIHVGTTYQIMIAGYSTASGTLNLAATLIDNNMLLNGDFSSGSTYWAPWDAVTYRVNSGVMQFYRKTSSVSALMLQDTGISLPANLPLQATFDLGNASSVRKRVLIILNDDTWQDQIVCDFWLDPNAPMRTYTMTGHTYKPWSSMQISFYANPADGVGWINLDNAAVRPLSFGSLNTTMCNDPTAPSTPGTGADSANLVGNGDFSVGMTNWGLWDAITSQITGGVFEFYRNTSSISAVVLQNTGQPETDNAVMELQLSLGNSSAVRKRVKVLVHDFDFTDLTVCNFWLEPGQALSNFVMRSHSTEPWNATTVAVYGNPGDGAGWIRLDNVSLKRRPAIGVVGTECYEPGSTVPAAQTTTQANTEPSPLSIDPGFAQFDHQTTPVPSHDPSVTSPDGSGGQSGGSMPPLNAPPPGQ